MKAVDVDALIFGGGIAGLWTLLRLRQAGYRAALVETQGLGGIQTLASQGIIHGGIKYSLGGSLSDSTRAIAEMPARWRACLQGHGELDLRRVSILTEHQYLWSAPGLMARLGTVMASQLLRGHTASLTGAALPEIFHHPGCRAEVYRLDEPVLSLPSLMAELAHQAESHCYQLPQGDWRPLAQGRGIELIGGQQIRASCLILAAGAGNAALLHGFGRALPKMQLRPLQMLLARGPLPRIYGHCLGPSNLPRLTISSHEDAQGRRLWYLGGQLAETGVRLDAAQLKQQGRAELAATLPWLALDHLEFAALRLERAEPQQPDGKRPERFFAALDEGILTLWPTKLAFAPALADAALHLVQQSGIAPRPNTQAPVHLPLTPARLAPPPWEVVDTWS